MLKKLMATAALLAAFLAGYLVRGSVPGESVAFAQGNRVFELRTYTAGEGKLDQRQARYQVLLPGDSQAGLLVMVDAGGSAQPEPSESSQLAPQWLHAMLQRLRGEMGRRYHIGQLIGESDPLRRVREQVRIASEACPRVLIVGPPGSGREHVARTIHYSQPAATVGALTADRRPGLALSATKARGRCISC